MFSHTFSTAFNNYLTSALLMGIYVISNVILFQLLLWQIILCIFSAIYVQYKFPEIDEAQRFTIWIDTAELPSIGLVMLCTTPRSIWVKWCLFERCKFQCVFIKEISLITLLTRVTNSFKVIAIYIYIELQLWINTSENLISLKT